MDLVERNTNGSKDDVATKSDVGTETADTSVADPVGSVDFVALVVRLAEQAGLHHSDEYSGIIGTARDYIAQQRKAAN